MGKSQRLGHTILKQDTERAYLNPASEVKTIKGYSPVACIKNNIPLSQAMIMQPTDLNFEDGKYLLDNGITKQVIKRQYSFKHDAALYARLKALGLHPWPPASRVNEVIPPVVEQDDSPVSGQADLDKLGILTETPPTNPPLEIITDPARIAEFIEEPELPAPAPVPAEYTPPATPSLIYQGFKWFYGTSKSNTPVLTVLNDGRISLPTVIRAQYAGTHIRIGLAPDMKCLLIGETDMAGRGVKPSIKQGKVRGTEIYNELTRNGVMMPAKYQMAWNEPEQLWAGTLIAP